MKSKENPMYIVKNNEQTCCTCDHWTGTRVQEEDGFVYSLKNLEGICSGIKHVVDGAEFNRALTFPSTSCNAWARWPDLSS
jgi:hypothetical protein